MGNSIAVINDINFFNLIEEFDTRFVYFKYEGNREYLIEELEKFSIKIAVISEKTENLEEILQSLSLINIEIILFGSGMNIFDIRNFYGKGLIKSYVLKSETELLMKTVKELLEKRVFSNKIALKIDLNIEKIIEIDKISSIQYDRLKRRTIFNVENKEYFLTKNLSEVEEYINKFKFFYRVDRSIILNIKEIDIINNSEEYIIMKNGGKVYISQSKLREIKIKLKDKIMFI